ncbi:outer membrane protein assembly factor BamB family protein [Streptomyces sp. KR80]|uniref:outer membrane protein assembly factor BamB family protein n=1 Tax=Streptomyces sp. KR80 TaxID=3457426 RepID=UPI003FD31B51
MRVNTDDGEVAWAGGRHDEEFGVSKPPFSGVVVLGVSHGMVFTVQQRARRDGKSWEPLRSRVSALDAETGRTLWTELIPDHEFFNDTPGFQAAQLVGSTLYITDLSKPKPQILATDVVTRHIRWKRTLRPHELLIATPIGPYTIRTQPPESEQPQRTVITALEPRTGHAAWTATKTGTLNFGASVPGALYLVERGDKVVKTSGGYSGTSRNVAVVHLDIRTRNDVRVPIPGGFGVRHSAEGFNWAAAGLYGIADGDTFYLQDDSGKTIAADIKSGRIRWKANPPMRNSMPTLFGQKLYYSATDGSTIVLDSHTGKQDRGILPQHPAQRFKREPLSPIMGANGRLYAVSTRNSVYMVETRAVP